MNQLFLIVLVLATAYVSSTVGIIAAILVLYIYMQKQSMKEYPVEHPKEVKKVVEKIEKIVEEETVEGLQNELVKELQSLEHDDGNTQGYKPNCDCINKENCQCRQHGSYKNNYHHWQAYDDVHNYHAPDIDSAYAYADANVQKQHVSEPDIDIHNGEIFKKKYSRMGSDGDNAIANRMKYMAMQPMLSKAIRASYNKHSAQPLFEEELRAHADREWWNSDFLDYDF